MIKASYEDLWQFWLDDACYCVARGARLLDIPSEVSAEFAGRIRDAAPGLELEHGVRIRCVGDEDGYEVQVARYGWVFDLLDLALTKGTGEQEHAMYGVLLGYDGPAIDGYLRRIRDSECEQWMPDVEANRSHPDYRTCQGNGFYRCPGCARYVRAGEQVEEK